MVDGTLSTTGLNSALLINWVEFFCDSMDDFNPGVEMLYVLGIATVTLSLRKLYFFIIFSPYHSLRL